MQLENVVGRLNRAIFALRRLRACCNQEALISAYYAYFESVARYGLLVWGNKGTLNKVLKLQKRAIRTMLGLGPRDSCRELFVPLGIATIVNIYVCMCTTTVHQSRGGSLIGEDVHDHYTRGRGLIRGVMATSSHYANSYLHVGLRMYNALPERIRQAATTRAFSQNLKHLLKRKAYYSIDDFFADNLE